MRFILSLLLLLPVIYLGAGVSLVSQTQEELVLEFTLPEYSIEHLSSQGATWHTISSDFGSVHSEPGYPELRVFSEAVAIPVNGDIAIQVSNVRSSTLRNINLKPGYKMSVANEEVEYSFHQDLRAYQNTGLYPLEIAQKGEPAFIGDRRFVSLQVFPFQYRAAAKELVINTSFTVRVRILGDKRATGNWQLSENIMDGAADSFFINNASSKAWRLPKSVDNSYAPPKDGTTLVNEIQLVVNKEGIYKIGYDYLNEYITTMTDSLGSIMAWELDTLDPRNLELKDRNGAIPIHFSGETDGSFDPADFFEFYGDRHYGEDGWSDDYTDENVYTLYLKNSLGARMAIENGGLIVADAAQYIVPDAYESTEHFEQQIIFDKLGNGWKSNNPNFFKEDTWFWRKINAPDLDIIPFDLQYPKDSTVRTASAKAVLHGLTYAESLQPGQFDHEATVRINQAMVNTHTWVGQTEKIFNNQNPIANSYFHHGTNNMYISLTGNTVSGTREQVLLDYLELTYWREYKTSQDKIKFSKPSNRPPGLYQFEIEGFSGSDVSVYKIGSSIMSNLQVEPYNIEGMAPWTVTLQDSVSSTSVKYYAVTESQKNKPLEIRLNFPSDLRNPANSADVILVSRRDFLDAEGTDLLVSLWEDSNHTVAKVDYQDIFDEFNGGIRAAQPLKEFFSYAYNNWASPQLKHIVLLGEGVNDERDHSPARKYTVIPIKMNWTSTHGLTASDNWYACLVGDDIVPDVNIARINVWEAEQILDYANKADAYRNDPQTSRLWNSHLTFSSGGKITDAQDIFAQQSERIKRANVPKDYRVTRVYTTRATYGEDYFGGTFDLKDAINSGTQYLQFMGHGGGRIWADYNLFNFNDVATLNNQTYPIVLSLACYASAWDTNGGASISEALILEPEKGAIATLGFSGLGYLIQDEDWGHAITEALFKHDFDTLGDATRFALARFYVTTTSSLARYACINGAALLGDPLIKPRKPNPGIPVTAADYIVQAGQTLQVNAVFPTDVTAARLYIMKNNEKILNVPYDLPVIGGNFSGTYTVPASDSLPSTRIIYVAGYSQTGEYVGRSVFGVGRAALTHHATNPASPAWTDSVSFIGKVFSDEPIISMTCKARTDSLGGSPTWVTLPMQQHPEIENAYITTQKLAPQNTGKEIACKYIAVTPSGNKESALAYYVVRGPEMQLADIRLETSATAPTLKVLVRNIGDAASTVTDLRLYTRPLGGTQTLFATHDLQPVQVDEERWESFDLTGLANGEIFFEVRVNVSNAFPEWAPTYNQSLTNVISLTATYNFYTVTGSGATIGSTDGNLVCEVPSGLVSTGQNALFYIDNLGTFEANNQPDIAAIRLRTFDTTSNDLPSQAYEVSTLNPDLADSTGTLINNKKLKLTYFYSVTDPETQAAEADNDFKIYRWEADGRKWILQNGNTSISDDKVIWEVSKLGIYTIYKNNDRIRPSIDVNVQDQEFTIGGYVSGTGTISLLLSDANGIDVYDSTIRLYLDDNEVSPEDYVISLNSDNVNRIPIKYQLNIGRGNYTLQVHCKDVNGNFNAREVQFIVNDTFDITNIGNYPNPVLGRAQDPKNDGRTRFTYVLTDAADEVTIKIYTAAGRLVKTFKNLPTGVGYHEYPRTLYGWDCTDETNSALANGVYFYKVLAKKGSKKIEKTMKLAIQK